MLSVYHAVVSEDKDQARYNVEDLLRSNFTVTSREGFQPWFGSSSSLVWKPKQPPPTCLSTNGTLCHEMDDRTCEGTAEFSPQCMVPEFGLERKECSKSPRNTIEDTCTGGVRSPLMKRMLKRETSENNTKKAKHREVKWCSCLSVTTQTLNCESQSESHTLLNEKVRRKLVNLRLSSNHRGKWVIMESDLSDGVCLEDLWGQLISEELNGGMVRHCNIGFQSDPSRILIYTASLDCVTVLEHFPCVREKVKTMSFVVHRHGELVTWNGKDVVI